MPKDPKILYQRELPGGGYVNVEEDDVKSTDTRRVQVTVERRTDPVRRDGHEPPVIAHAEGHSLQGLFRELVELAQDNVAIARALLKLRGDGRAQF